MPVNVADAGIAVRADLKPFLKDVERTGATVDSLGKKLDKALSPRALSANAFGKGPDELARSFGRAADSADEAFEAVRKLGTQNIDTAKARKYAQVLDEIGIEAQQTLADLRQLQATDPRFNTPALKAAADQLDRVGKEAADSARSLNAIKGVGASTEFERMAHEAREAGTALDTTGTKLGGGAGLLGKLKGVKGALIGLGIGLGAQQLLSFAGDAVEAFGNLEQSAVSIQTIFGDSASVIEEWGERAADAAGLSKREVNEAAAVMGQTLLNMGYSANEAADMVVRLQQRAADLALAFGKDPQDAILAIGSVLRGERDTIEKFGVSIKQADVENRILALGLDTSTTEARKNAEAMASLDLVLDQSATSAGRFVEGSDDISVQLAQLRADAENAKASFGGLAARVEQEFFGMFEDAEEAGEGVARWIAENQINGALATDAIRNHLRDTGVEWEDYAAMVRTLMLDQGLTFEQATSAADVHFQYMGTTLQTSSSITGHWADDQKAAYARAYVAVDDYASGFAGTIVEKMNQGRIKVVDIAFRLPSEVANALRDGRDEVQRAADQLAQDIEDEMAPADEIAALQGQLTGDQLAQGLESKDPIVRQQAQALFDAIQDRLTQLGAYAWGSAIARAWADGIASQWGYAHAQAVYLGTSLSGPLEGYSPPREGPLKHIDQWGTNVGQAWADGLGQAASLGLEAVMSPSIPIGTMPGGAGGGVAASQTINYNLNVNGVQYQVSSAEEAVEQLQALGVFSEGRV